MCKLVMSLIALDNDVIARNELSSSSIFHKKIFRASFRERAIKLAVNQDVLISIGLMVGYPAPISQIWAHLHIFRAFTGCLPSVSHAYGYMPDIQNA